MPLVMNISDRQLPFPDPDSRGGLTSQDLQRLYRLQSRSTLPFWDEQRHLEPLGDEERAEMEALELRWNDRRMPKWGELEMPFAPMGEQGSVWSVDYRLATTVIAIHPKRLKVVSEDEIPAGVVPQRHRRIPTIAEQTPGWSATEANAHAHQVGPVLTDATRAGVGRLAVAVKEQGWAGAGGGGTVRGNPMAVSDDGG